MKHRRVVRQRMARSLAALALVVVLGVLFVGHAAATDLVADLSDLDNMNETDANHRKNDSTHATTPTPTPTLTPANDTVLPLPSTSPANRTTSSPSANVTKSPARPTNAPVLLKTTLASNTQTESPTSATPVPLATSTSTSEDTTDTPTQPPPPQSNATSNASSQVPTPLQKEQPPSASDALNRLNRTSKCSTHASSWVGFSLLAVVFLVVCAVILVAVMSLVEYRKKKLEQVINRKKTSSTWWQHPSQLQLDGAIVTAESILEETFISSKNADWQRRSSTPVLVGDHEGAEEDDEIDFEAEFASWVNRNSSPVCYDHLNTPMDSFRADDD